MERKVLGKYYPNKPSFEQGIRRAPSRVFNLSKAQEKLALKNALRYIPPEFHEEAAAEFLEELKTRGRIYGYRYRPSGRIYGKPISEYKGKCIEGKAFQVMIDNNLDFNVALYPYELVTYGETGQVCQNWMQYLLIKEYLEELTDEQTLVISSGHPMGLFPSDKNSPRVIITIGLLVGLYDNQDDFDLAAQLGVSNYGQMTAGGWMYIGPQGIVHGTFNTILNAGRKMLGVEQNADLAGLLFVSSGLGGMSGAQPKAGEIAGCVTIVAEVDISRIKTRLEQGWVKKYSGNLDEVFKWAENARSGKEALSIAYHGNIVNLLNYADKNDIKIDLLSDQTSCHVPYDGGYCPVNLSFEQRTEMLSCDRDKFKKLVNDTLRQHFEVIRRLTAKGTYFFDYGNSFLKSVYESGVREISRNGVDDKDGFIFPSYVEDIMGPELFDYGYGPFRWVCLSGNHDDLKKTDAAAMSCIDPKRRGQDRDNYIWIKDAEKNHLVVGTQARILYQDAEGRKSIALKFNELIRNNEIGPVMIGRDHHDVSGTDSPFRETSNIRDGSNMTADMAIQCYAGNAARGMSLVALHNGGGVGVGKAINGGFGLVLDGSERVDNIIKSAMLWDVMGGVARRAWARNEHAVETAEIYNKAYQGKSRITIPYLADEKLIDRIVKG